MSERRHDLDAVRSLAMLLGIALHAALAFIGIPWVVQDPRSSEALGGFVALVHGFRMPLFFLLSGFFTAMLWQRRGLGGLLLQRAKRILVPLAVGCVTLVPLLWVMIFEAAATNATYAVEEVTGTEQDLWKAAATGNLEAVERLARAGADLDAPDPVIWQSPLAWAVAHDRLRVVDALLARGADPSARFGDQNTALHTAAFFGRLEATRRLLRAGGDVEARNVHGEAPIDSLRHDRGTTVFIAGILKAQIDYDDVLAGRSGIRTLLEAQGAASEWPTAQEGDAGTGEGTAADRWHELVRAVRAGPTTFPLFHHLWFLWFLCWLVAGFAVVTLLLRCLPMRPRLPRFLCSPPLALLWLVPLTMLTQSCMRMGGELPGFGPDTSAGLLPMPHVLCHYAIFFGFGAVAYLTPGAGERLGRGWSLQLPLAFLLWPAALALSLKTPWGYELAGDEQNLRLLASLGESLFAWLMIFGTIGLFQRLLSRERYWVRYLSDSTYWLYLVHLPLVIAGQAQLRGVPLPALLKFALLLSASTIALLASYRWLVRYTFVGRALNGPRTRPGR